MTRLKEYGAYSPLIGPRIQPNEPYNLKFQYKLTLVEVLFRDVVSRILHIQVSAGDGDVSYGRRRRCLVWPETEMSCMAGDDC